NPIFVMADGIITVTVFDSPRCPPTLKIDSVTPSPIQANSPKVTVTIKGSNFTPTSEPMWIDAAGSELGLLQWTFVSSSEISTVLTSDLLLSDVDLATPSIYLRTITP